MIWIACSFPGSGRILETVETVTGQMTSTSTYPLALFRSAHRAFISSDKRFFAAALM
jgi:hypothetical protein